MQKRIMCSKKALVGTEVLTRGTAGPHRCGPTIFEIFLLLNRIWKDEEEEVPLVPPQRNQDLDLDLDPDLDLVLLMEQQ